MLNSGAERRRDSVELGNSGRNGATTARADYLVCGANVSSDGCTTCRNAFEDRNSHFTRLSHEGDIVYTYPVRFIVGNDNDSPINRRFVQE